MKLNLGCGPNWKAMDADGLDIVDFGQEYVINILDFIDGKGDIKQAKPISYYDEIIANHFLEHFDQEELRRIFLGVWVMLKPRGTFIFVVPHKKRERAWVLPHKTFWNEATVRFLEEEGTDTVYGFGKWKIEKLVTNSRGDIHTWLRKK